MTVKHWFRLMRAAEWDMEARAATSTLPIRAAFFRRDPTDDDCGLTCPWSPPVMLSSLVQRRELIDNGVPEHVQILAMRALTTALKYGPSSSITH